MWILLEGTFTLRSNQGTGRELEHWTLLNCQLTPCLLLSTVPITSQDKSRSNSENGSFQKHLPEGSNIRKTVLEHSESQPSPLQCPQPVTQSRSLREDTENRYYTQHIPWVLSKASRHVSETSWARCSFHVLSLQKTSSIQHELHPQVWLPIFKLSFNTVEAGIVPPNTPLCQLKDRQHAFHAIKTPLQWAAAQCSKYLKHKQAQNSNFMLVAREALILCHMGPKCPSTTTKCGHRQSTQEVLSPSSENISQLSCFTQRPRSTPKR